MKELELTLVWRDKEKFEVKEIGKVESDDFVELMSQFVLLIALVMRRKHEDELAELRTEDNIPF